MIQTITNWYKRNKELIRNMFPVIWIALIGAIFIFWMLPNLQGMMGTGENIEECYPYTNSTYGVKYIFGKCYVDGWKSYETHEVCKGGIIGIGMSCYESSEIHYKSYRVTKCYIAKTGEEC